MHTRSLAAPALLALAIAPPSLAQDAPPDDGRQDVLRQTPAQSQTIETPQKAWTIKFEPAAWYAAAEGNLRLPGGAASGNGDTYRFSELNMDSPRVSPFGELQLKRGDWRICLNAVGFATGDRGSVADGPGQIGEIVVEPGDTLRSSLDLTTLGVSAAYAFHGFASESKLRNGAPRLTSTLMAVAGMRALDVGIDVERIPVGSTGPSGAVGDDALHAHPFAGLRWELEVHEDFTIDLEVTLGGLQSGDSESWSSDILVGFQWNPTHYFGAQVGYRQLLLGIESGEDPAEFAWQGGLAGVYAGATLRF